MRKHLVLAAVTCMLLLLCGCQASSTPKQADIKTAEDSIQTLKQGNADYLKGGTINVTTNALRQQLSTDGQHPYAVVITCSDSRVPVEEVFSCNAGEIFVVRTAGNVIGDLELGSIEYGAEHCGAPLILVLGHSQCGAVTAAVEGKAEGNNIDKLVEQIQPAVAEAKKLSSEESVIISEGVRINVENGVQKITADPTINHLMESGKVQVTGAIYDISTGQIQWL